eukprot:1830923-Rhodomonas_salina.2
MFAQPALTTSSGESQNEDRKRKFLTSAQPRGRPRCPDFAAAMESIANPRASLAARVRAAVSTPVAVSAAMRRGGSTEAMRGPAAAWRGARREMLALDEIEAGIRAGPWRKALAPTAKQAKVTSVERIVRWGRRQGCSVVL